MLDAQDTFEACKAQLRDSRIHVVFDGVCLWQPDFIIFPT